MRESTTVSKAPSPYSDIGLGLDFRGLEGVGVRVNIAVYGIELAGQRVWQQKTLKTVLLRLPTLGLEL